MTSKDLAQLLSRLMAENGVKPPELAALCGVKVPSVYDWMNYGRIAKRHLPVLAKRFDTPLSLWVGGVDDEEMLSPQERKLVALFREMGEEFKQRLIQDARYLRRLETAPPPAKKPPVKTPK